MGVRQWLNQRQTLAVVVASTVICIALGVAIWEATGRATYVYRPMTTAFYSDDGGKTWYVDDATKVPPFDHKGKEAVRARIFRCKGGKPFLAYLERYSDAVKASITKALAEHPVAAIATMSDLPREVRKPGGTKWVSATGGSPGSLEYARITTPTCPDGGQEDPIAVSPEDPDNGATN